MKASILSLYTAYYPRGQTIRDHEVPMLRKELTKVLLKFWRKYIAEECPDDKLERLHRELAIRAVAKLKRGSSCPPAQLLDEKPASEVDG